MNEPETNRTEAIAKGILASAGAKAYAILSRNPVVTLAIAAVLVFAVLFGPALLLGIKDAFTTPAIEKTKQEASAEKTAADQEKIAAGEIRAERKAEDQRREQEITPERQRAADRLAAARQERETLENNYEKNKQTPRRPPVDDLDLRRRNCADLAELLPGQRVAGCQ